MVVPLPGGNDGRNPHQLILLVPPRNWYPSRAPKELAIEERRLLVEMAVEACVVQLLVTGFVHADPHEGNLRQRVRKKSR